MDELKDLIKQWNELPELQCNFCGAVFKGEHECDYKKLKEENKELKEHRDNLNGIIFDLEKEIERLKSMLNELSDYYSPED